MIAAFDVDGTLDENPAGFGSLMAALKAAGHRIAVLTGCSAPSVTEKDLGEKANYLTSLGVGNLWDELVVCADPVHETKAAWVEKNMSPTDLLFDNSKHNAKACKPFTTVCVVWNSKVD